MRYDRFTVKSQEALQKAIEIAQERGNPELSPLHLLLALLHEEEGVIQSLIAKLGIDAQTLVKMTEAGLKHLPQVTGAAAQPAQGGRGRPRNAYVQEGEARGQEGRRLEEPAGRAGERCESTF